MTRAKEIYPQSKRLPPVQCETTAEELGAEHNEIYSKYRKERAANRGFTPDQCTKQAKYEIDGRKLCGLHAGIAAINILRGDKP
jgi:hypothetical protein